MHHNKSLKSSFINPDLGPNFNFLRIHLHIVVSQSSFVSSASVIRFIQFARKNSVDFLRSFFLQSLCWLVTSLFQFRPANKILFTKNPNPQNNCLNFQRTWKNRALQYQEKKTIRILQMVHSVVRKEQTENKKILRIEVTQFRCGLCFSFESMEMW